MRKCTAACRYSRCEPPITEMGYHPHCRVELRNTSPSYMFRLFWRLYSFTCWVPIFVFCLFVVDVAGVTKLRSKTIWPRDTNNQNTHKSDGGGEAKTKKLKQPILNIADRRVRVAAVHPHVLISAMAGNMRQKSRNRGESDMMHPPS